MLALAAFLVSAAFEPIGLWFSAVLGYALFLRRLRSAGSPVWSSLFFGFLVNAIVLHWSSKYVGALPWILLSLLQAIFYAPVGWVFKKTQSLRWAIFTILICEELRARFPFGGFSWTRIAFSQVDSPLTPLVSYGGVLLLSFATLLLALLFTHIRIRNTLIAFFVVLVSGFIPSNAKGAESLSLIAIQGNTPSVGLEFNSRAKAVFDLHRDATQRLVKSNYDAIIWPENAIDIDPRNYPEVATDIEQLTKELQTPLIAGVVLQENGHPANASMLYGVDGQVETTYIKRYLTPFGEYMPLRGLAEIISPFAKSVNDFKPGDNFVAHTVSGKQISPIICYEIINDGLVREGALNTGAFIVQTNSATFANTAESAQQLAITRIRAIEHSREILSVSTVGISAFIDNNGVVKAQTAENVSTSLSGELGISSHRTWSDRLGGVAPLLTLLFSLFFAARRSSRKFAP